MNALNVEKANTRLAGQRAQTTAAEARSNEILAASVSNDPTCCPAEVARQAALEGRRSDRYPQWDCPPLDYDQVTTQDPMNALNVEKPNTRIAEWRARATTAEARSNDILAASVPTIRRAGQ